MSLDTETHLQAAASPRVVCSGQFRRYASPETPSSIAQPSRADSVCEESSHPLPIVESRIEQHHQELE